MSAWGGRSACSMRARQGLPLGGGGRKARGAKRPHKKPTHSGKSEDKPGAKTGRNQDSMLPLPARATHVNICPLAKGRSRGNPGGDQALSRVILAVYGVGRATEGCSALSRRRQGTKIGGCFSPVAGGCREKCQILLDLYADWSICL